MKYDNIPLKLEICQCKLCFRGNTKKKYRFGNGLFIYVCQECGFHFVNYLIPTAVTG